MAYSQKVSLIGFIYGWITRYWYWHTRVRWWYVGIGWVKNPNAWHGRQIHRRLMVSKVLASPESQFSILQMDLRNLYGLIPGRTIKHREYFHLAKGGSLKPLWIFGTDDPKLHLRSRLRIQHGLEPQNGLTLAAMSLRRLVGPAQRWTSWTKIIDFDSGNPRGLGLCQLNEWPCIF
jgi:hypothetical protein